MPDACRQMKTDTNRKLTEIFLDGFGTPYPSKLYL